MNFPLIAGPDPDYAAMRTHNLAARTMAGPDGQPVPDPGGHLVWRRGLCVPMRVE